MYISIDIITRGLGEESHPSSLPVFTSNLMTIYANKEKAY